MNRLTRQSPTITAGIVHLGLGAFSRAHIALYTDDAVKQSGGDWGIVGVSLRSTSVRDALEPQQYAYTAVQLGPSETTTRQVEIVNNVLVASEDTTAILELMANPAIKIISLTITEKGYYQLPANNTLDLNHPEIRADLSHPIPTTAIGFIVRALEKRMENGHAAFTVLSCDNVPQNGVVIKDAVLNFTERCNPALAQWIQQNACFPSTMVDRITPATTQEDIHRVEKLIAEIDLHPVMHEPYSQWVIEDNFVDKQRPDWHGVGAKMVSDVKPFELMKLRMLNGTHSALAYLGYLAGFKTIAQTVTDKDFNAFTKMLWQHEIIPTLQAPPSVSLTDYADELMMRYSNPNIQHLTWQIAMDGSQKLPQRILNTIDERNNKNIESPGLILSVAAWMRYVGGVDENGEKIDVRDPFMKQLASIHKQACNPEKIVSDVLSISEIFPRPLREALEEPVTKTYKALIQNGAHEMVRRMALAHVENDQ